MPPDESVHETFKQWNDIVQQPANHKSIDAHLERVRHHIQQGRRDGRYLIVDAVLLSTWPEIFISPLGVVDKPGAHGPDVRIINDYSYPQGGSVNDLTDRANFPLVSYNLPRDIARRIHSLKRKHPNSNVLMMIGDVSGVFRHVPVHENAVHMFAFMFDGYLVIDLSCGFGWCGSPAFYSLAGSVINHLYERQHFAGSVWCDDHTCIEIDAGSRCYEANLALRWSMASVLGPRAINENKFTHWSTTSKALGLQWNTVDETVSIPAEKILRAQDRVKTIIECPLVSKSDLRKLLGSLRHVASCFPSSRSFFQRIHCLATAFPLFGRHALSDGAMEDLRWFHTVLKDADRFNGIPVAHFAQLSTPSVHVYMDASDDGLCALEPSIKSFIRCQFTQVERDLFQSDKSTCSINIRELKSAVLAALHWGSMWSDNATHRPVHVCFHIDNTSAVAWANKRNSTSPIAQMYSRLLALVEFQYNLVCTAEHIPGVENVMADAGSRAWSNDHPLAATWANMSLSWSQVPVHAPFDDLSTVWDLCCADTPWHALPTLSIDRSGNNGAVLPI